MSETQCPFLFGEGRGFKTLEWCPNCQEPDAPHWRLHARGGSRVLQHPLGNWVLWRVLIRLWGDAWASELRFVAKSPKRLKGQFSLMPCPVRRFPVSQEGFYAFRQGRQVVSISRTGSCRPSSSLRLSRQNAVRRDEPQGNQVLPYPSQKSLARLSRSTPARAKEKSPKVVPLSGTGRRLPPTAW
jgi:hypothetical protein